MTNLTFHVAIVATMGTLFSLAPLQAGQNAASAKPDSPAAKTTPRTPNGHPDLTGFWMNPRPSSDNGGDTVVKSADGSVYFNAYTDISPDQKSPALVICTNEACQSPNQPPLQTRVCRQ